MCLTIGYVKNESAQKNLKKNPKNQEKYSKKSGEGIKLIRWSVKKLLQINWQFWQFFTNGLNLIVFWQ